LLGLNRHELYSRAWHFLLELRRLLPILFEGLLVQGVVKPFSCLHVVLEGSVVGLDVIEELFSVQAVHLALHLALSHLDFFADSHLQNVFTLFDRYHFVKFDRFVQLVALKGLRWLHERGLLDILHHFAILWRELVFYFPAECRLVLHSSRHFQEGVGLEEFPQVR